jgi:hypothetical protein
MIDNVDDILELLKELPENGEPDQDTIWMIQKQDDLEKILMQMRDLGHTPQCKFERNGKLSMILDQVEQADLHHQDPAAEPDRHGRYWSIQQELRSTTR